MSTQVWLMVETFFIFLLDLLNPTTYIICLGSDLIVINAQLAKLEMSMSHMREIHGLAIQREKLQIRVLEQQLDEQTKLHQFRLDNEREMHQLRLKHEQELHLQRMRYEQEQIVLQQGKIHEVHGYTIR